MKGGQLIEKNANSFILGPILWIILDILGGLAISLELSNFLQKKLYLATLSPCNTRYFFLKIVHFSIILSCL